MRGTRALQKQWKRRVRQLPINQRPAVAKAIDAGSWPEELGEKPPGWDALPERERDRLMWPVFWAMEIPPKKRGLTMAERIQLVLQAVASALIILVTIWAIWCELGQ